MSKEIFHFRGYCNEPLTLSVFVMDLSISISIVLVSCCNFYFISTLGLLSLVSFLVIFDEYWNTFPCLNPVCVSFLVNLSDCIKGVSYKPTSMSVSASMYTWDTQFQSIILVTFCRENLGEDKIILFRTLCYSTTL